MGEDECGKSQRRREIREQRRISHLDNHPLKRHGFVPVALILGVVFIDQINAIGHSDNNHQRRDQARHQIELVIQQDDASDRPHHSDGHHDHAHPHDDGVPEKQEQKQRRDQKCCANEVTYFVLHLVGHFHANERQAAEGQFDPVLLTPVIRDGRDVLDDGAPAVRIE